MTQPVCKVTEVGGMFYILVLSYNNKVWRPWHYLYFKHSGYPTENIEHATPYDSMEEAETDMALYVSPDRQTP